LIIAAPWQSNCRSSSLALCHPERSMCFASRSTYAVEGPRACRNLRRLRREFSQINPGENAVRKSFRFSAGMRSFGFARPSLCEAYSALRMTLIWLGRSTISLRHSEERSDEESAIRSSDKRLAIVPRRRPSPPQPSATWRRSSSPNRRCCARYRDWRRQRGAARHRCASRRFAWFRWLS